MPGAPTPQTLLEAIASSAGGGFITNPIPDAPTGTNAASVQGGFPPVTMQEELAGGEPPLGQDMNGYLFLISSHTLYVQCGQPYLYSSALATAISGYLAGTLLGMADGTGLWLNIVNGNTTNPDTGGAGWVPMASYGFANVTGLTGGVVTLTALQARREVIVLAGVLTSNLTVNLPETTQEWLIVNTTTGAFTTKVQTAAATGSVTVPQGGFGSPTQVYGIGDGNIYPRVAPLSVPIDQAPTPSTLVERTNTGAVLATVFNSNEAATNPTIDNVIVDAGDGNFQKISAANFVAQLFAAAGSGTLAPRGSWNTPFGLVVKWGTDNFASGAGATIVFPGGDFPNNCYGVLATRKGAVATAPAFGTNNATTHSFSGVQQSSPGDIFSCFWIALGD